MGRSTSAQGAHGNMDGLSSASDLAARIEDNAPGAPRRSPAAYLSTEQLIRKPVFWAYAILMTALGSLIITFIALAANTANHCVWINGVCFDRPQGGYV